MDNRKFGQFTRLVVEIIDEEHKAGNDIIPASTVTLACETHGFCTNMEAFDMLQILNQKGIILYTPMHTLAKGKHFEMAKHVIDLLLEQAAKTQRAG